MWIKKLSFSQSFKSDSLKVKLFWLNKCLIASFFYYVLHVLKTNQNTEISNYEISFCIDDLILKLLAQLLANPKYSLKTQSI